MRATFVLLTDWETQNFMRKLAVELDAQYQIGLSGCLLPAHVSLKQPFQIRDCKAGRRGRDTRSMPRGTSPD